MATSGVVTAVPFVTRRVIDLAYQRCGLYPANITPEMLNTAEQLLSVWLHTFCNRQIPSWCIERLVLPMYEGVGQVNLPTGTINALNVNYRVLQPVEQDESPTPALSFTYEAQNVSTVGVLWNATSVATTIQASTDGATWVTVGTIDAGEAVAGEWTWVDVNTIVAYTELRLTAASNINAQEIYLGSQPQEIPLGPLNRDQYADQSNKVFKSQPTTYFPLKNYPLYQLNLWPVPNTAATRQQLVVWRHRHVMDVGTLRQNVEVPIVWNEAMILNLAAMVAPTVPTIPMERINYLEGKAAKALNDAWEGDGDGTMSQLQVDISPYTSG